MYKRKIHEKRRVVFMLNDKICKLREELNDSILNGQDYSVTYELSIALDELIAEYYKVEIDSSTTQKLRKTKAKMQKKLICY